MATCTRKELFIDCHACCERAPEQGIPAYGHVIYMMSILLQLCWAALPCHAATCVGVWVTVLRVVLPLVGRCVPCHSAKLCQELGVFLSNSSSTKSILGRAQSLVVLRGLMGVGLGGAPVAFALFLELVPSSKRGVLMVALQSFWTIGSMLEVRGH